MTTKWLLPLILLTGVIPAFSREVWIEPKGGYFYPTSDRLRDFYSPGGGFVGAEITGELTGRWYGFLGSSWFSKSGHSDGLGNKTTINLVPIQAGFKYLQPCSDKVDAYFGLGFQTDYVHFHDHSSFVVQKSTNWGYGAVGKFGFLWTHCNGFFLDLFAEYAWIAKVHFSGTLDGAIERVPVDVSAISSGIGIGYRFGSKD